MLPLTLFLLAVSSPEAIEAGRRTFVEACSACHGPSGEGGHGPNLAEGRQIRRLKDDELFAAIKKGVAGTDMPPYPGPDENVRNMVAFLRSLSQPAAEARPPGDPEAGRSVFFGKGECSRCHMIRGQGGSLGPDLTDIGSLRTIRQLRESVVEPNARVAGGFQRVAAVTKDGAQIAGVAKNYDNYSIQVLDAEGRLHLLYQKDLRKVDLRNQSLMPADYSARLSEPEIRDLLAFLSRQSLRGTP